MPAILIGGEKGGTGKSTIATNLAVMASLMGKDVLLLDLDNQGTSARFIEKRNEKGLAPTPACVQLKGQYLNNEIEDLLTRYELLVIDAGGYDSKELRITMACPGVIKLYTPFQSSEFDMETIGHMDEMVGLAKSYNKDLRSYIVFNQSPTHSKITLLDEAYEWAKDLDDLQVLEHSIGHRVPFKYAATEAMAVVEFELDRIGSMPSYQAARYSPKSSIEMCALYKEAFEENFTGGVCRYFKTENQIMETA